MLLPWPFTPLNVKNVYTNAPYLILDFLKAKKFVGHLLPSTLLLVLVPVLRIYTFHMAGGNRPMM